MTKRRPNRIRCHDCDHDQPLTRELAQTLPSPCPECGGRWQTRCGAKLRGKPRTCRKFVKAGNRCKLHGGASLKGPAAGAFVDGSQSKFWVPPRYLDAYSRGMDDPLTQGSQRRQLALLDGLQEEALRRIGTGEAGALWEELRGEAEKLGKQFQRLEEADAEQAQGLTDGILQVVKAVLLPLIQAGADEEAARRELVDLFRRRAKLIRVEQQGQKTVSQVTLDTQLHRFLSLVTKYLGDDRKTLSRFLAEIRQESVPGWKAADQFSEGEVN